MAMPLSKWENIKLQRTSLCSALRVFPFDFLQNLEATNEWIIRSLGDFKINLMPPELSANLPLYLEP